MRTARGPILKERSRIGRAERRTIHGFDTEVAIRLNTDDLFPVDDNRLDVFFVAVFDREFLGRHPDRPVAIHAVLILGQHKIDENDHNTERQHENHEKDQKD